MTYLSLAHSVRAIHRLGLSQSKSSTQVPHTASTAGTIATASQGSPAGGCSWEWEPGMVAGRSHAGLPGRCPSGHLFHFADVGILPSSLLLLFSAHRWGRRTSICPQQVWQRQAGQGTLAMSLRPRVTTSHAAAVLSQAPSPRRDPSVGAGPVGDGACPRFYFSFFCLGEMERAPIRCFTSKRPQLPRLMQSVSRAQNTTRSPSQVTGCYAAQDRHQKPIRERR